jgi:DNA-binding FadR family transcriptional regulator
MDQFATIEETTSEPTNTVARGSLLLTKIRGGNAYEEAVERILQTIRLGLMQPGEQLPPERELALMLDVSRDTVRDATSSLAEAGYLVIRRGRYGGTFIAEDVPSGPLKIGRDGDLINRERPSREEIADILTFRVALESGAAYEAAASELSRESRDGLWQAHLEAANASPDEYRRLDSRLHLLIGELTGSSSLVNQVAQSRMRVNELLDDIPLLQPNVVHSNQQHEQIVMAILTGQAEKASAAMRAHLEGSASLLRGFLA